MELNINYKRSFLFNLNAILTTNCIDPSWNRWKGTTENLPANICQIVSLILRKTQRLDCYQSYHHHLVAWSWSSVAAAKALQDKRGSHGRTSFLLNCHQSWQAWEYEAWSSWSSETEAKTWQGRTGSDGAWKSRWSAGRPPPLLSPPQPMGAHQAQRICKGFGPIIN